MLGNLSTFVSKKLGVVIALATMVSQVAEVSPEIALAKIVAYAALGVGYVIAQALSDAKKPVPMRPYRGVATSGWVATTSAEETPIASKLEEVLLRAESTKMFDQQEAPK